MAVSGLRRGGLWLWLAGDLLIGAGFEFLRGKLALCFEEAWTDHGHAFAGGSHAAPCGQLLGLDGGFDVGDTTGSAPKADEGRHHEKGSDQRPSDPGFGTRTMTKAVEVLRMMTAWMSRK